MDCKISVVIPALTESALVIRTLNTALRQTLPPLEIMACAVSEDAAEVLDRFRAGHGNISVFSDVSEALASAQGEYVFFLNENVTLAFSAFARLAEAAQGNPRNLIYCGLALRNTKGGYDRYDRAKGKKELLGVPQLEELPFFSLLAYVSLFSCLFETAALQEIVVEALNTPGGQIDCLFRYAATREGLVAIDPILIYGTVRITQHVMPAASLAGFIRAVEFLTGLGSVSTIYILFIYFVLPMFKNFEKNSYPDTRDVFARLQAFYLLLREDSAFCSIFDSYLPQRASVYTVTSPDVFFLLKPSEFFAQQCKPALSQDIVKQFRDEFDKSKTANNEVIREFMMGKYLQNYHSSRYRIDNWFDVIKKTPVKFCFLPVWFIKAAFRKPIPMCLELDIRAYFACLSRYKHNFIIVIAVKDTPGLAMTKKLSRKINKAGFQKKLHNQHWHSYIGVVDGGHPVYEALSVKEESLSWSGIIDNVSFIVESKSFNAGNAASVKTGGIDYAINRRGLNIVVVDKATRQVLDTVCFDTHEPGFACSRVRALPPKSR